MQRNQPFPCIGCSRSLLVALFKVNKKKYKFKKKYFFFFKLQTIHSLNFLRGTHVKEWLFQHTGKHQINFSRTRFVVDIVFNSMRAFLNCRGFYMLPSKGQRWIVSLIQHVLFYDETSKIKKKNIKSLYGLKTFLFTFFS